MPLQPVNAKLSINSTLSGIFGSVRLIQSSNARLSIFTGASGQLIVSRLSQYWQIFGGISVLFGPNVISFSPHRLKNPYFPSPKVHVSGIFTDVSLGLLKKAQVSMKSSVSGRSSTSRSGSLAIAQ